MKSVNKILILIAISCYITILSLYLSNSKSVNYIQESFLTEKDITSLKIDYNELYCPLNINDFSVFDVSEINNKESKVEEKLFYKLFQENTIESEIFNTIIPAIKHTREYLLTKHNIDSEYDFITLLKETEEGNKIFWLSYLSKDLIYPAFNDSLKIKKGTLTNFGILSESYENDSIKYSSYSEFFKKNRFKITTIKYNKLTKTKDSTISFLELAVYPFNDGFKAYSAGDFIYQNGKETFKMIDEEYNWNNFQK